MPRKLDSNRFNCKTTLNCLANCFRSRCKWRAMNVAPSYSQREEASMHAMLTHLRNKKPNGGAYLNFLFKIN